MAGFTRTVLNGYTRVVRILVLALAVLAGFGILGMMTVTCADVTLRMVNRPITGALDIVTILSALTIACALPYTTAVKGHVAIEYFFLKLSRRGRIVVDTLARLAGMTLFAVLASESVKYGQSLKAAGEVSTTLRMPIFWVLYVIAFSCAVTVLVILHNLLHPGKEMIKP
jgi:TRAP-type C4-dicarboxylate transport system permease small subunit